MSALRRWFWSRRDHGFRHGYGPMCARCGGFEYGNRHPRGMVGPDGWLR